MLETGAVPAKTFGGPSPIIPTQGLEKKTFKLIGQNLNGSSEPWHVFEGYKIIIILPFKAIIILSGFNGWFQGGLGVLPQKKKLKFEAV